jgi:hypothetical protein
MTVVLAHIAVSSAVFYLLTLLKCRIPCKKMFLMWNHEIRVNHNESCPSELFTWFLGDPNASNLRAVTGRRRADRGTDEGIGQDVADRRCPSGQLQRPLVAFRRDGQNNGGNSPFR